MGLPELALALRWPFWGFHAMQSTSYSGHLGCFACWWCGTSITHFLAKTSLLDRSTKEKFTLSLRSWPACSCRVSVYSSSGCSDLSCQFAGVAFGTGP